MSLQGKTSYKGRGQFLPITAILYYLVKPPEDGPLTITYSRTNEEVSKKRIFILFWS